jgi:5-methylcytosine-specific restriction enzyme A
MSRRAFIESQGATCKNWSWSWSFINEDEKVIIFGAWDINTKDGATLILSEDWKFKNNKVSNGYKQAYEHMQLVEYKGYQLKTFPMVIDVELFDQEGEAKIQSFEEQLYNKAFVKSGSNWYAVDEGTDFQLTISNPDELDESEGYTEGAVKTVSVNAYERNPQARERCLAHHGYSCAACGLNFEKIYGDFLGSHFIHVHHKKPLYEIGAEYNIDPIQDLVPVCPNCHAMIHRVRPPVSIADLKRVIEINRMNREDS